MKSVIILLISFVQMVYAARVMEYLDRGAVQIFSNQGVFLIWRIYGTEDLSKISFDVYRDNKKLNSTPIKASNFLDKDGSINSNYQINVLYNNQETGEKITKFLKLNNIYHIINLQVPAGGTTPDGVNYTYSPNDCSVGDLDGDGEYEIVLKWDPSNSKDNSQSGYTGNVYLDAYKLDGTFMWRIDLGVNIRAGAHYTQFLVYDFDCDGKAEIMCKTAPGTKDGTEKYLSKGPAANDDDSKDYRNSSGYILSGPEYLTVFKGETGEELATVNYIPARGNVSSWGDSYGNRVDRFLACVAYLDGQKPSAVFQRGYYTRMVLAAWDWDGTTLKNRWIFDSNNSGSGDAKGQGNHNLSVGDVDGDGKDEIIQGACAIDDDGRLMYSTKLGHGDAMHLGDLDPDRPGLEVWEVHEDKNANYGYEMHDAKTGEIIWGAYTGTDNGRGLAADIDINYKGYEMWSSGGSGVYSCKGKQISTAKPTINFRMYWDDDFLDEILDGTKLDKWTGNGTTRLVSFYQIYDVASNNGTKQNPGLVADILGDWREEVIFRSSDNKKLVIFTTNIPTDKQMYTLMHDPVYRLAIAWQNTGYNQPPHLGFWLAGENIPKPDIEVINNNVTNSAEIISPSSQSEYFVGDEITLEANVIANSAINKVTFYCKKDNEAAVTIGSVKTLPYKITWTPTESGVYTVYVKVNLENGEEIISSFDYKLVIKDSIPTMVNSVNEDKEELKIYPNPASKNSVLRYRTTSGIIEIYNAKGQKIFHKNIRGEGIISCKELPIKEKGIYVIVLKEEGKLRKITFYFDK